MKEPTNHFDTLHQKRYLSAFDKDANDLRWKAGKALKASSEFTQRYCKMRVGENIWTIIKAVVLDDEDIRSCRRHIGQAVATQRADAIIHDRLRNGLDIIGTVLRVDM
jgi:hypothetical protein